jgi:hypothetical protein
LKKKNFFFHNSFFFLFILFLPGIDYTPTIFIRIVEIRGSIKENEAGTIGSKIFETIEKFIKEPRLIIILIKRNPENNSEVNKPDHPLIIF